jgi:hypothetical protein
MSSTSEFSMFSVNVIGELLEAELLDLPLYAAAKVMNGSMSSRRDTI